MAMVKGEYLNSQSDVVLVEGVQGKIILVLRMRVSSESTGAIRLRSDPGGPGATDLTPKQFMGANGTIDLEFGRQYAVATGRGKALGFTSVLTIPDKTHSVIVWYELVD